MKLGLAFQIADDLLDLTADTATLGKRAGKDAAAGKSTLPALARDRGGAPPRRRPCSTRPSPPSCPSGARADALRALARFVVARTK